MELPLPHPPAFEVLVFEDPKPHELVEVLLLLLLLLLAVLEVLEDPHPPLVLLVEVFPNAKPKIHWKTENKAQCEIFENERICHFVIVESESVMDRECAMIMEFEGMFIN